MKVYCYKRCGTCQKALKYLNEHHIDYEEIDIQTANITYEELLDYYHLSQLSVKRFINTSGKLYRELNLKDKFKSMSDEEIIKYLSTDGMLIKRPLLIDNDKVLVGFKIEEWESHFND